MPVVAILAQGAMGAGIAGRLVENGVEVITCLEGRSAASSSRAEAAGMRDAPLEILAQADVFLSIVPPRDAADVAERLAPLLAHAARKAIYVDCNAVDVPSVERIAASIAPSGAAFVDGSIIGAPPKSGGRSPVLYLSGEHAAAIVPVLAAGGLDARVTPGPVGAASALKMSYAGITKGMTGLVAIMFAAAARAGTADALRDQLASSEPEFLKWFERRTPGIFAKAYRWVAEMEEIAGFLHEDPQGAAMFNALADLYRRIATDLEGAHAETDAIAAGLRGTSSARIMID